jgi:glucosamine--fructose-6-phosphate aminotransferase (isomerizing)
MLDEIRQQPAALEKTLRLGLRQAQAFRKLVEKRRPRLIVLAARGTSDNAAQFGRYLLEMATGIPVSLAAPSIYTLYRARVNLSGALVAAISQSGESTDTNVVLRRAREQGALTVGITNEPKSSLAKLAEHVFLVRAGKEKSVAATKTYTGQVMLLYLLVYALGGKVRIAELERIPEMAQAALSVEPHVRALSERYRFMHHAIVVGRGINYANAFEFALKMMETCYVVAERFSSADFLHGPIALVEPNFPVFLFAPSGVTQPSTGEMLEKLRALKAETVVITDAGNAQAPHQATRAIRLPKRLDEVMTVIPYVIPAQLFAACLAAQKGLDPDRPRTLSKVTQTL